MHIMFILSFVAILTLMAVGLVKAAEREVALVASVGIAESYARSNRAIVAARQCFQHTRAHCISMSSGRALAVDVLAVNADGTLQLRRRGHRNAMPYNRPASAMFSR